MTRTRKKKKTARRKRHPAAPLRFRDPKTGRFVSRRPYPAGMREVWDEDWPLIDEYGVQVQELFPDEWDEWDEPDMEPRELTKGEIRQWLDAGGYERARRNSKQLELRHGQAGKKMGSNLPDTVLDYVQRRRVTSLEDIEVWLRPDARREGRARKLRDQVVRVVKRLEREGKLNYDARRESVWVDARQRKIKTKWSYPTRANTVFAVGDKVYFGRPNGEKTLAKITKINRKTYKVTQLESRGTKRNYAIGSEWTVPHDLVWAAQAKKKTTKKASTKKAPAKTTKKTGTQIKPTQWYVVVWVVMPDGNMALPAHRILGPLPRKRSAQKVEAQADRVTRHLWHVEIYRGDKLKGLSTRWVRRGTRPRPVSESMSDRDLKRLLSRRAR